MSAHLKAIIGVLFAGTVFGLAFWGLYKPTVKQGPVIDLIEQMKEEGVPLFKMETLFGRSFDLKEFKNEVLIINFWASWCEPCIAEVPSLISLVEKMKGKVTLIAVSTDSYRSEIAAFLKSCPGIKKDKIHLLWDEKKTLMTSYGVNRLPETFVVGRGLKLSRKIVGAIDWEHPETIQYFNKLAEQ
jgi:cytochrome c biogenesis protein CcmG, thiol:disulfide interchange protein DsbE